eukprot:m.125978 g.125978  ORF g.125978 m.125978 type:complete len:83 (+) comp17348_c0_seq1:497-745(+)
MLLEHSPVMSNGVGHGDPKHAPGSALHVQQSLGWGYILLQLLRMRHATSVGYFHTTPQTKLSLQRKTEAVCSRAVACLEVSA